jgi:hypothetical protein
LTGVLSTSAASFLPSIGQANDLPTSLKNARDQFINYIISIADGAQTIAPTQQLVLNSLILPLDLSTDTPYFNDELFRLYADSTFSKGGVQQIQRTTPASQAARFSFQYQTLVQQAGYQIDQNHPEIQNSLNDLSTQLDVATTALDNRLASLDADWEKIANGRGLKPGSNDYLLQQITWQAQVRYGDQISRLSQNIDKINSQIAQVRRKVYTPSEQAVLDNLEYLGSAYAMARPWFAQVEIEQKQAGAPITALMLGNVQNLNPGMFDEAPLILPQGNLSTFLTAPAGNFGFDTGHWSYQLSQGASSWAASGGVSFSGWSVGGGGSGSSSFSRSMTTLNQITLSFDNIAEYMITRGGWFQPGVLQDPKVQKVLGGRPEFSNLQYVAVSLILVRGTKLTLKFSQAANSSDWSQRSFAASGGVSFMGFGFSAGGSNSSSSYTVNNSADWTTVNIIDAPSTVRVIGARVEPFIPVAPTATPTADAELAKFDANFGADLKKFNSGQLSYVELQNSKITALKTLKATSEATKVNALKAFQVTQ